MGYYRDPDTGEVMLADGGSGRQVNGFGAPPASVVSPAGMQPPEPDGGLLGDPDADLDDVLNTEQPEPYGPGSSVINVAPNPLLDPQLQASQRLDAEMADAPGDEPGMVGGPPLPPPGNVGDEVLDPYGKPTLRERRESLLAKMGDRAMARTQIRNEMMQEEAARRERAAIGFQEIVQQNLAKAQHDAQVLDGHIQKFREMKVDPKKFFADAGTGGTVLMALGVMLGGFDSPLNRGRNPAMDIINRGIEREMKAQMANIKAASTAIGMEQNLLAANRRMYQDEQLALIQTERMIQAAFADQLRAAIADQPEDVKMRMEAEFLAREEKLQAAAAKAQFDRYMKMSELDLKRVDRRNNAFKTAETMRHNRATEDLGRRRLALDWYKQSAKMGMGKGAPKAKVDDFGNKVWNGKAWSSGTVRSFGVAHPVTGDLIGIADKGEKKEIEELRRKVRVRYRVAQSIRTLISFARKHGDLYSGPLADKLRSESGKRLDAMWKRLVLGMVKEGSGLNVTDAERQFVIDGFKAPKSFTTMGDVEKVWMDKLREMGLDADQHMRVHVTGYNHSFGAEWSKPFPKYGGGDQRPPTEDLRKKLGTASGAMDVADAAVELGRDPSKIDNQWDTLKELEAARKALVRKGYRVEPGLTSGDPDEMGPIGKIDWARKRIYKSLGKREESRKPKLSAGARERGIGERTPRPHTPTIEDVKKVFPARPYRRD